MLEHIWSSHFGTTLKYKVLLSFLRNIIIFYSNKGRGKCHANVGWHLEFTPWLNAYIQVLATVILMLEHIWSSHFGMTLKYKVLLIVVLMRKNILNPHLCLTLPYK
jgi:hypothetical protein